MSSSPSVQFPERANLAVGTKDGSQAYLLTRAVETTGLILEPSLNGPVDAVPYDGQSQGGSAGKYARHPLNSLPYDYV